jgi:hypothetical protein
LTNNEIDFSGLKDINKLVRLEAITFGENAIGQPIAYNDFTTEWKIKVPLANETTQDVIVRTSNYAKFRNTIIQDRTYNLTGILTVYKTGSRINYQLMIRSKEDIEPLGTDFDVAFDFTKGDALGADGWSNHSLLGTTKWVFRTDAVAHQGNNNQTQIDDWFVSPVIKYPEWQNGYLHLFHRLKVENAYFAPYQVYYTTTNSTTFNTNDWKELGTISSFPANYSWGKLPLAPIDAESFRIAFRYNAPDPTTKTYDWYIQRVEIKK